MYIEKYNKIIFLLSFFLFCQTSHYTKNVKTRSIAIVENDRNVACNYH